MTVWITLGVVAYVAAGIVSVAWIMSMCEEFSKDDDPGFILFLLAFWWAFLPIFSVIALTDWFKKQRERKPAARSDDLED